MKSIFEVEHLHPSVQFLDIQCMLSCALLCYPPTDSCL